MQPYLSVVVTTRNDDHGGSLLGRTQAFVNGLLSQCRRHKVPAELIIVEWNPPPDRPPLSEALHWRDSDGWCQVRIIEVPLEMHQRWRTWKALPLYQMTAKNVGIRRARGEFVLATNIDILFSDELMQLLAERRLDPGKMYRVNRWDIMSDVPVNGTVEEQLAYCNSHLIRLSAREGTFRVKPDGSRLIEANDIVAPEGPVQLGKNWFHRELSGDEAFRWVENDAGLTITSHGAEGLLVCDIEPGPGMNRHPLRIELRDEAGRVIADALVKRRSVVAFAIPAGNGEARYRLHTRTGGAQISTDIRTLNFRVFRCTLETGSRANAQESGVVSTRPAESAASRAGRGFKLLRDIWHGDPKVKIRLPMSRERMARLQLHQDESGFSFSPSAFRSGGAGEVFPPGMRSIFGPGWYPIEHFGGETFYWMKQKAEIVWLPPLDAAPGFSLFAEPGPSAGFQPCELIIRDQWGDTISTHNIKGRTVIRLVTGDLGPVVMSFEVRVKVTPAAVPGDSREMALRIFGSRWDGKPGGEPGAGELMPAGPGVWCGSGWQRRERTDGDAPLAFEGAELLLRAPDTGVHSLILEAAPVRPENPAQFIVKDTAGRTLFEGVLDRAQNVPIEGKFEGGKHYSLRLRGGPESAAEDPWLSVPAIQWQKPGAAAQRVPLRPVPEDRVVNLHTNACGDFTLLALDRWIDLRGYPELDLYSLNIDSLFCWAAHHGGAREEVLEDPYRIYHIEHGEGSGWTPEGEQKLYDRLAAKGLSWLEFREVMSWARVMNRFDMPMIFNREDWGLGHDELKETLPEVSRENSISG